MSLAFLIIAACMGTGVIAAFATHGPLSLRDLGKTFSRRDLPRFSPRNTLFIIGPAANHSACKLQRRLLKPAIAALIREDVSVMEVYGDATPRKNGEPIDWLDASLLRHAMNAEEGFFVIYVDRDGKTLFRSEAPMPTVDLLREARLDIAPFASPRAKRSLVLRKLEAA